MIKFCAEKGNGKRKNPSVFCLTRRPPTRGEKDGISSYLVNVRQDSSSSDRSPNQTIQFLISTNRQLQMPRRDTFDPQIFRSVSSQLEDFSGEIFEDRRGVDGSFRSDSHVVLSTSFQVTMDTTDWELISKSRLISIVVKTRHRSTRWEKLLLFVLGR